MLRKTLFKYKLHQEELFDLAYGYIPPTTVLDRETTDGKLMAVHTRHEYTNTSLPSYTSRPEQYYGECEVQR